VTAIGSNPAPNPRGDNHHDAKKPMAIRHLSGMKRGSTNRPELRPTGENLKRPKGWSYK